MGGAHLVAMDFQGSDVADEDVQEQLKTKQKYLGAAVEHAVISVKGLFYRRPPAEGSDCGCEKVPSLDLALHDDPISARKTIIQTTEAAETKSNRPTPLRRRLARFGLSLLHTLIMPCSASIILGFVISIVPVLKALFVPDVLGVNMPSAPDGQPPLAFLLDTMTFVGNASVPLGLIILGSALARLKVPGGRLRSLPLGAIGALTFGRLVVMPVFGVLITQGLTQAGLLNAEDNVLRFVCMYVICPCFLPCFSSQRHRTASCPVYHQQRFR